MSVSEGGAGSSPQAAESAADPIIGTTLKGTYRVLRKIGEGGMGCVYEAEHVRLRRRVAIKVLLAQYSSHPEVIARFQREAEIIGSLGHPHIVQVIDVDQTDAGEQFLVMEFLEGETLADRLEREPRQSFEKALKIASQVGSALAGTHDKGIVHRDLKPENIFLVDVAGEKDFVKVLDFGISKVRRGGGPKLTAQNVVIGTPAYMAPEQARADQDVDHRADQFALAAITFELLAGQSPYPGDDPIEVMREVVFGNPRELAEVAPWVPPEVARVIMRGLSRVPAERYGTVTELVSALSQAAAGKDAGNQAGMVPAVPSAHDKATLPRPARDAVTQPRQSPPPRAGSDRATRPQRSPPPRRASSRPPHPEIADSARTPPPPPESHRIEHVVTSRRGGAADARSDRSPRPPNSVEVLGPVGPRQASAPPDAIDRVSANPPRVSEKPADGSTGADKLSRAEQHHQAARVAFNEKRLDEAVEHAERLMELGVFGRDTAVFEVLRAAMPLIDRIFEARVGSGDRSLRLTALGRDRAQANLSSRAVAMLDCVAKHDTVDRVLSSCGVPRRDAVRMLAGLMRRRLVE